MKDVISSQKGGLVSGERIFAIPTTWELYSFPAGEGPFYSINFVIQNSKIYAQLKDQNSKRAHKIILDKYVIKIADYSSHPKGTLFEPYYINAVQHSRLGEINKGKLSGIHFYNEKTTRIIKLISSNNKGVWSAIIESRDKNGKWVKKEIPTTFFPNHWDKTIMSEELLYAVKNKKQKNNSEFIYEAKTLSGISIEIVIVNNVMKTIYPIL